MNISYLENVASAKKSLIIWFSNIEQMDKGIQMFSKENTLQKDDTQFGKWYTGEGQTFSSFETFRAIEEPYNTMYSKYIDYIELYNKPIKKSFFSNSVGKRKTNLSIHFEKIRKSKDLLIDIVSFFEKNLEQSLLFKKDSEKEKSSNVSNDYVSTNVIATEEVKPKQKEEGFVPIEFDNNQEEIANSEHSLDKKTTQLDKSKIETESKEIDIEEEIRRILN